MLKPKTGEDDNKENELVSTAEPRTFYTPIKSVRINSTQNEDINVSRNMVTWWRLHKQDGKDTIAMAESTYVKGTSYGNPH